MHVKLSLTSSTVLLADSPAPTDTVAASTTSSGPRSQSLKTSYKTDDFIPIEEALELHIGGRDVRIYSTYIYIQYV